jgi:hypothetical protein
MKTPEDEEFERIEKESGWRKRQIMAEDDDDIQDYKKPWVGLTNKEAEYLSQKWRIIYGNWVTEFVKEVETILRKKNT